MTTRIVALHSEEASLVLECCDGLAPLWRHLGARVAVDDLPPLAAQRPPASYSLDADVPLSLAPPAGLGWFGPAVIAVRRDGRAVVSAFTTERVEQGDDSLVIALVDQKRGMRLVQRIALAPGGAFLFDVSLTNCGNRPLEVDWLASALLPLPSSSAEMISWHGRHNGELIECHEAMPRHTWLREGRRGIPGHGGPAAVIVCGEGAGYQSGLVHSAQLAWSGDARLAIERDDEGFWTLSAGATPQPGEIVLQPGESHAAPQLILALTGRGRNAAMAQHHAAVRARMTWPGGAMRPRPVHANSWEACYFEHDEQRILALAEAAARVGVERFVLDDGWFRGRNDDTAGLGDWTADPVKYPQGLKSLAQNIVGLGLEFGLWVEPEMINPDSELYRAHPEWALAQSDHDRPTARNQLVLDMARPEVSDYLFAAIDALLRELPISYLKWDHNRDLAPAGGHAQVQGTYALLKRLRQAHPGVEIESCAGGGGRSDAGISAYTHRFWTSDNLDPVCRASIQRGFLSFLPPEVMGAHIGASPAHATGRQSSLGFRAAVAMPGHFGIEMDPRTLEPAAQAELAGWIAFHKQWRDLLHGGQVWLGSGADGLLWQAQGKVESFLLFVSRCDPPQDRRPQPLALPFLANHPECAVRLLRIAGGEGGHAAHEPPFFAGMRKVPASFTGSWLAQAGLPLPPLKAETVAIFHIEAQPAASGSTATARGAVAATRDN